MNELLICMWVVDDKRQNELIVEFQVFTPGGFQRISWNLGTVNSIPADKVSNGGLYLVVKVVKNSGI